MQNNLTIQTIDNQIFDTQTKFIEYAKQLVGHLEKGYSLKTFPPINYKKLFKWIKDTHQSDLKKEIDQAKRIGIKLLESKLLDQLENDNPLKISNPIVHYIVERIQGTKKTDKVVQQGIAQQLQLTFDVIRQSDNS